MLMSICSYYNVVSVLVSMIATLGVSAAIFLFATQTKWDFTSYKTNKLRTQICWLWNFRLIGIAYLLGISLLMFGINAILFAVVFNFQWLLIIYGWLSSILVILYMMIDIQVRQLAGLCIYWRVTNTDGCIYRQIKRAGNACIERRRNKKRAVCICHSSVNTGDLISPISFFQLLNCS